MIKNLKAFTLAELLVSFSVLAFVSILTVTSILSSAERKKAEALIASQGFYESISSLYLQVTSLSNNPVKIKSSDSEALYNAMMQYLDFSSADIDCGDVDFNSFNADKCVKLTSGIKMGIKVNSNCDSNLDVYEFLKKDDKDLNVNDIQTRNVANACGYLIYRTKGSNGIFKEDAFIIPLGAKSFK